MARGKTVGKLDSTIKVIVAEEYDNGFLKDDHAEDVKSPFFWNKKFT